MHGASGTGKTRAAWDILRRHHFARRWRCGFVKVFEFNQWAHDAEQLHLPLLRKKPAPHRRRQKGGPPRPP